MSLKAFHIFFIVASTLLALAFDWDTHHVKLAEGFPEQTGAGLALWTSAPQLGAWIPATVLLGGFFGCLGGMAGRRKEGVEP